MKSVEQGPGGGQGKSRVSYPYRYDGEHGFEESLAEGSPVGGTDSNPSAFPFDDGQMANYQLEEVRDGLRQGIGTAKAPLETNKAGFLEELGDAEHAGTAKTLKAYEGVELHQAIERAAGKLFHDGHYANAVAKDTNSVPVRHNSLATDPCALHQF
jgi:hypothetical protein